MEIRQEVLAFLNREPLLRVLPLETVRRGDAMVKAAVKDGVLLYDSVNDVHYLCADSEVAALSLLPYLPEKMEVLTNDVEPLNGRLMKQFGFRSKMVCLNTVYTRRTPVPVKTDILLAPLSINDLAMVQEHYHSSGPDYIADILKRGRLLGGFLNETMIGFIGWHDEGSMGLLHVFEEFRRQGYDYQMEALHINGMLEKGQLPFGQVETHNQASLALQRKLGLEVSERTASWLFY